MTTNGQVSDKVSEFITTQQAADMLGVHGNTVRNWATKGVLRDWRVPGTAFHRFARIEIEALNASRQSEEAGEILERLGRTVPEQLDFQAGYQAGLKELSNHLRGLVIETDPDREDAGSLLWSRLRMALGYCLGIKEGTETTPDLIGSAIEELRAAISLVEAAKAHLDVPAGTLGAWVDNSS